MTIKASEFYHRLVNRDEQQGDGQHTAIEFREKYLSPYDNKEWWQDKSKTVELDFEGIKTLGPSWANEAFAYFTKYDVKPDYFFKKFIFVNISSVKKSTIKTEIETGYCK